MMSVAGEFKGTTITTTSVRDLESREGSDTVLTDADHTRELRLK